MMIENTSNQLSVAFNNDLEKVEKITHEFENMPVPKINNIIYQKDR